MSSLRLVALAASVLLSFAAAAAEQRANVGYYRSPALHGDVLVFASEGDLWRVGVAGGVAHRLTTHPDEELAPVLSPDGRTLAFVGQYEGPREVYTMPVAGGRPQRWTYDGRRRTRTVGWTPDGRVLHATDAYSGLPDVQLAMLDPASGVRTRVPLAQAAQGAFSDDGRTLFFTRLPFQGSHTKRYQGGMAQDVWRYREGSEAVRLTGDHAGTDKAPAWHAGRVYFLSDREGTLDVWSMDGDGRTLRRETDHADVDVLSFSVSAGRLVYQVGPDLHLLDLASRAARRIDIVLPSDFDHLRENWVDEPMSYLTAAHPSADGESVALTARGQVFVVPRKHGRLVEVTRRPGVRYRAARFMPDGKDLVALSDQSGEVEVWTLPSRGVGQPEQHTTDGRVLRWEAVPSPDGRHVAHHDKDQKLWILDVRSGRSRLVDESAIGGFDELVWSPDGRWLAYSAPADNAFTQVRIARASTGAVRAVTTDRFDSFSPTWSADGDRLYLLSDRNLETLVRGPWGSYQPEPYLHRKTKVYELPLRPGLRSPFQPSDELSSERDEDEESSDDDAVEIEFDGIAARIREVPLPPGTYRDLQAGSDALYLRSRPVGERAWNLVGAKVATSDVKLETIVEDVSLAELTLDRKRLLVRKGDALHVIDAKPAKASDLKDSRVDLSGWRLSVQPNEEWRQMFREAWRLERDYFYDRGMHGVDWPAAYEKYVPWVDRVRTRRELSEVIAQMVSELSALHTYVYGGDARQGPDEIAPASLGAVLARDEARGGYRVVHVHRSDPDEPDRASPLARPGVEIPSGAVIQAIDGVDVLSVPHPGALLREKAGRQVLLDVRHRARRRQVIVTPMSAGEAADLRYHEWELERRERTEDLGDQRIGYVHLRAMGGGNYTEWAKGFYPVFDREGLIVDVRHNRGGNIDSWILEKLLRKAWSYWNQRVGRSPSWNMQYAFRGHLVVLVDQRTASDGEAFAEGARRLGLGTIMGMRTWGGEIWLTSSNALVDRGIATAAEFGVFGPEGEWLIEGHGVDPDVVVDNLPHETFQGRDAQLDAAVAYLLRKIEEDPVELPPVPAFPDKSVRPDAD